MSYQSEPVAKRIQGDLVEYICPQCGGLDRLCEIYHNFPLFVDHLIWHLCLRQLPQLSRPFVTRGLAGDYIWYRKPGKNEIIPGLPRYSPDSPEWQELLEKGQKLLPQAKFFLPDIAGWLEESLLPLEELESIKTSNLLVAEKITQIVREISPEFEDQRNYLLKHEKELKDTGMDPKWPAKEGRQAGFIAWSLAGARWKLTPSSSREFVRQMKKILRAHTLNELGIRREYRWWKPFEIGGPDDQHKHELETESEE